MAIDEWSRREFIGVFANTGVGFLGQSLNRSDVEVVHTRVFAATPTGGNPCPVIARADGLADRDMLRLAKRFELDTAFIVTPKSPAADIAIRYFVPDHEMGVSGHATVAAVTVAQEQGLISASSVKVETASGVFVVECQRRDGRATVLLEQLAPTFGTRRVIDDVASSLKLRARDFDVARSPIQSVSVSRAKLLVPLRDSDVLDKLKPDFDLLWHLCETFDVSGFYPFTRRTHRNHANVEARQFPYRAGFLEDAATGVAAGALAAYLTWYDQSCRDGLHMVRVAQGYAMGAPSLIEAGAGCSQQRIVKTFIRGSAVIVGKERVSLDGS